MSTDDTPRRSALLRWAERGLWTAALVLLGWVVYSLADGEIFQMRAAGRLDRALAETARASTPADDSAAHAEASTGPPPRVTPASGDPIGRLEIPRLGVSVMVAEGSSADVLRKAVGHLTGTALPGSGGNVALAGHRDRYFRPLKDIRDGDEILLTTPQGTFRYRVEWTRIIDPTDLRVLAPTGRPSLTLLTCYPFHFVGHAPHRFAVRARRIGWQPAGVQPAARSSEAVS
jgi:sortase A